MSHSSEKDVTQMLLDWSNGDGSALDRLTPIVYGELRRLADSYMRRERADHTLQATALVHEAYLKLIDQTKVKWESRAQFFGLAAQVMRNILVDYARSRAAAKRGSGERKVSLEEAAALSKEPADDMIALDEAMKQLAAIDARKSRIIELRYFGGLGVEETAEVMSLSVATIRREMRMAEAWLYGQMKKQ